MSTLKTDHSPVDPAEMRDLQSELRAAILGEVRFSDGDRALYATDSSNYRQTPIGIVVPKDAGDVAAAVNICRKFGVPILPRGTGTSLAGMSRGAVETMLALLDGERPRNVVNPEVFDRTDR